ncbi:unnamed protein product [Phytomonas sp. EM1]|nr:unnamed protein product [Phytomonas sp. EM1]|eukprot:CCW60440.1 unnamed protein product [Phytomonas sp. isolate EM1]
MRRKPNSETEKRSSSFARDGGVFQDYSFRFSKLYTVLDKTIPSVSQQKTKTVPQPGGGKPQTPRTTAAARFNTLAPIPWKVQSGGNQRHEVSKSGKQHAPLTDGNRTGDNGAETLEINVLRNPCLVQPQVLPIFVGSVNDKAEAAAKKDSCVVASTESSRSRLKRASADELPQIAVGLHSCKPVTRLHSLPSPAFGSEVKVNVTDSNIFCESDALSKYSLAFAASLRTDSKSGVQNFLAISDSPAGEHLYDLWKKRLAMRGLFQFRDELESFLYDDLENLTSSIISQEEYNWNQCELEKHRAGVAAKTVFINPKLVSLAAEETNSQMDVTLNSSGGPKMSRNDLSPSTVPHRSVIPAHKIESLFVSLRAQLHQRTVSLLQTYTMRLYSYAEARNVDAGSDLGKGTGFISRIKDASDPCFRGDEVGPASPEKLYLTQKEKDYISELLQTEQRLTKDAVLNGVITPATVSLPEERIIKPLVALETAASVALLWQVLKQCEASVPKVGFAMELFHSYLLPHVYENFALYTSVLPSNGTLSEQVTRLSEIPLRSSMRLLSADSTQQCRKDMQYMESVLQHWALRSWRRCMMGYRRRLASLELASKMLLRVRWRLRLQKIFGAWRLVTFQEIQESYFSRIKMKYNSIVNSSCISTESAFFPNSSILMPSTVSFSNAKPSFRNETQTALARSRFLAVKLAESAQHKKKASSTGTPSVGFVESRDTLKMDHQMTRDQDQTGDENSATTSSPCVGTVDSFIGQPVGRGKTIESDRNEPNRSPSTKVLDDTATISSPTTASPTQSEMQPSSFVEPNSERHASPKDPTLDTILDMLQEENEVCAHLRSEIAIQRRRIQTLERERNGLQERNRTLEADLVRTLEEKIYYCNLSQKKQFQLMDQERHIVQLRSRLRAHRTRPWQRVTMRIAGELCGASTQASEAADERRVRSDLKATDETRDPESKEKTSDARADEADEKLNDQFQSDGSLHKEDDNSSFLSAESESGIVSAQATREAEEERLFGELAPIVLSSTTELPSAMTILQDWANSCLDDLETLDDLKGGALSLRFRGFSEEVRSGVLLSRLLFYLALPRYLQRNANNDERSSEAAHAGASVLMEAKDGKDEKGKYIDTLYAEEFIRRRMQLLEHRNVQLDAPFPVYSECFGDLLNITPTERMAMLLHFASQILNGSTSIMSDAVVMKRQQVLNVVCATAGISLPPSVPTIDLHEVVDPHALAIGERTSIVTLIAILYVRFAHPFNHKSRQSAIVEKEAIFYLLNPRGYTSPANRHLQSPRGETEEKNAQEQDGRLQERQQRAQNSSWIEDEILERLIDEDKSPWQLFKERCVPMFGSSAHPFLLRGNFWPSEAFESPQLANLLGELGMALNRSLQVHRWHILFSCLIPVTNYSRVSRGVFTGPRASPVALRIGLKQEGVSLLPSLSSESLERVYAKRKARVIAAYPLTGDPNCVSPLKGSTPSQGDWRSSYVTCEKRKLREVLSVVTNDLMNLFLCNASLQPELALPAMDLSEWRSFCVDLGIVKLQRERGKAEDARINTTSAGGPKLMDLNFISKIFYKAIHSHAGLDLTSSSSSGESDMNRMRASRSVSELGVSFDRFSDLLDSGVLEDNKDRQFIQGCDLNIFECVNTSGHEDQRRGTEVGNKNASPQLHPTLLSEYLVFPAFVIALVLLVNALYHPVPSKIASSKLSSDESSGKDDGENGEAAPGLPPILWLGDAITQFLNDYTLREDSIRFEKTPQAVLKRIQMGIPTQEVLTRYSPALLLVYQAYSKEIYGVVCMQEESLLQLMRDAMLTSTETTQYLISEIFQKCSTLCKSVEESAIAFCRDLNGRPRDRFNNKIEFRIPSSRVTASTSPQHVAGEGSAPANSVSSFATGGGKGKRHEVRVLTLDGFIQFLCVLCHFKQPNPLTPLHQRLEIFLRRSVLRPLSKKIENLSVLLKRQDN